AAPAQRGAAVRLGLRKGGEARPRAGASPSLKGCGVGLSLPTPRCWSIPRALRSPGGAVQMARDLGTKYICYKCGTKFYDLKKPAPTCPKCGADQRDAPVAKPASGRAAKAVPAKEPEEAEAPATEDEEHEAEDEESDDEDSPLPRRRRGYAAIISSRNTIYSA